MTTGQAYFADKEMDELSLQTNNLTFAMRNYVAGLKNLPVVERKTCPDGRNKFEKMFNKKKGR